MGRHALAIIARGPAHAGILGSLRNSGGKGLIAWEAGGDPWGALRAWITKRVHPHGFRRTLATELLVADRMPLPLVSRVLGHGSTATTDCYVRAFCDEEVADAMRARN